MKNHFLLVFLLLIGLSTLQACNRAEDAPAPAACTIKATFRNNICGVGVWGAYVLELENGEIVQPWDAPASVANLVPTSNQVVRVTVTTVPRDTRYDNTIVCLAIGPYSDKIARQVRVDCISADSSK